MVRVVLMSWPNSIISLCCIECHNAKNKIKLVRGPIIITVVTELDKYSVSQCMSYAKQMLTFQEHCKRRLDNLGRHLTSFQILKTRILTRNRGSSLHND